MSWLSKVTGIHLGNKWEAPLGAALGTLIAPGIGTSIGAGLGQSAGSLAAGHSVKTALEQGAVAGGGTYLGTKIAPAIASKLGSLGGSSSGASGAGKVIGISPSGTPIFAPSDDSSGWLSKLGPLAGLLPKNKDGSIDLGKLAGLGLGAAGAVSASKTAGQADKYRQQAIDRANTNWSAGAPLRQAGTAGLLKPLPSINVDQIYNQPRPDYRKVSP